MDQQAHSIPIKPQLPPAGPCPACGQGGVRATGLAFPGMHVLGSYLCGNCGADYFRDLPVGFAIHSPSTFDRASGEPIGPPTGEAWVREPLLESYAKRASGPVKVERIVNRPCKDIILLNTLDFLYGHVLLKLFNAQHYLDHDPGRGLVIMLPRSYAWLAPKEAAEIWLVDLRLGETRRWNEDLDKQVQAWLGEYDRVALARAYSHPRMAHLDISRFCGIKPFAPEQFDEKPVHITFIARTDRLWYRNGLAEFLHRAVKRLGLGNSVGRLFLQDQDRLMRRTMRLVRRSFPQAAFAVAGLGKAGGYGHLANDMRTRRMDEQVERKWCRAYAESQVVMGVHGSNMLLPTAFAAACVEVLPDDRIGNIVQDIFVRYEGRMQLFNYRFVDERASPAQVAHQITGILRYHRAFHKNMCVDTL